MTGLSGCSLRPWRKIRIGFGCAGGNAVSGTAGVTGRALRTTTCGLAAATGCPSRPGAATRTALAIPAKAPLSPATTRVRWAARNGRGASTMTGRRRPRRESTPLARIAGASTKCQERAARPPVTGRARAQSASGAMWPPATETMLCSTGKAQTYSP